MKAVENARLDRGKQTEVALLLREKVKAETASLNQEKRLAARDHQCRHLLEKAEVKVGHLSREKVENVCLDLKRKAAGSSLLDLSPKDRVTLRKVEAANTSSVHGKEAAVDAPTEVQAAPAEIEVGEESGVDRQG